MQGKLVLVTGATDGIGKETARQLVARGATVLVHGRSEAKARAACVDLASTRALPVWADLASLDMVRALGLELAARYACLDVLVNNAGVFMQRRELSHDGYELTFAVNHLAPFLLTHLLLGSLGKAPQGRIVNVSSVAHSRGRLDLNDLQLARDYQGYRAYAASKLANVLFTHELARRLGATAITANALHPGVIGTKLLKEGFGMGGASVEDGARTSVYLAADPKLSHTTGRYFADCREVACATHALAPDLERALYEESARLTRAEALPSRD